MPFLKHAVFAMSLFAATASCSLFVVDDEPFFRAGDYGGDPLPGTESLYNVQISRDGSKIALLRKMTPGNATDPKRQLWIMNRDASDPQLVGVNVNTVEWSPDGNKLALTVVLGTNSYIYVLDRQTSVATQWSGTLDHFFSNPTAGNPVWFQDGVRMLISVSAKAYQQPFERGIYIINTRTEEITGPLNELMEAASLGGNDTYAIGVQFTHDHDPRDGNPARYNFESDHVVWLTTYSREELNLMSPAVANPIGNEVVQSRYGENAWQLFLMESIGRNFERITNRGGDNPRWSSDGGSIVFRRDVHKGEGARYIPFILDMTTMESEPLWPNRPDSLPDFPDLSTQAQALDQIQPLTRVQIKGGESF